MPVLQLAADSGFAWLQDQYWGQQERKLEDAKDKVASLLEVSSDT